MPLISIITINYNNKVGLDKTLESVFNQTYKEYEYILIDGGSTDGSIEVIKKHSEQITYWVSEKDCGIYNAQNKGIKMANGDYCLFLNSGDVLYANDVLQKIVEAGLIEDILYGDMIIKWPGGNSTYGNMPDLISLEHMIGDTVWHPVSFIRRSLFQQYGNYDESLKMVADYDFFFKVIIAHKVSTKHVKLPVTVYNTEGLSSKKEFKVIEKAERKKVQEKYLQMNEAVLGMPLVSVIIPCYNCGSFLGETLNSVLAQTYTNWECLIVDNGSTDTSSEVANNFVQKDSRFHCFSRAEKGVSGARNFGISTSKGKYILPLDADDKIAESYMAQSVRILESNKNVKVVYCEAELFGNSKGKWVLPDFSIPNLLIENVIFCTAFFRRADFNKTAGYDVTMDIGFEDWDFWLRLLGNGGEVYRIPQVLFYYRIKATSRNNQIDIEKQKTLRSKIYQNHIFLYEKHLTPSDVIYELYACQNKLKSLQDSLRFKLAGWLMAPLYLIQRMFKS